MMAAALCLPAPPAARWSPLPPHASTSTAATAVARQVRPPRRLTALRAKGEDQTPEPPVRTLLIDNYDSYTYNIFQELSVVNGGE
jgi:para-aminobenzoate synthetase